MATRLANRAILVIRSLFAGTVRKASVELPRFRSAGEWTAAGAVSRAASLRVLEKTRQFVDRVGSELPDGQLAFERLTMRATGGGYGAAAPTMMKASTTEPGKGEVVPLVAEALSFPAPGTRPVELVRVSKSGRWHFDRFGAHMLRGPGEVDTVAWGQVRPY